MRKTLKQIQKEIKDDFEANLNNYISSTQEQGEDWFTELEFTTFAPKVENDRWKMGIYFASPEGSVYKGTASSATVTVALDCILSDDVNDSNLPVFYLSAVLEYLRRRRYGVSSTATYAETARVDLDADVNAFSVAIEVTVYDMDFDI